jgi:hypothetical protein
VSTGARLAAWYATLLRFYPRAFREEFKEEMVSVFSASLEEAAMKNDAVLMVTGVREIRGAIAGSVREHLRQLRKRSPLPRHLVLRSTLGFALGWTLFIVLRAVFHAVYTSAGPTPPLFDVGVFHEMLGFAIMGFTVVGFLGYAFGRGDGAAASILRALLVALGFALSGGITTVLLRVLLGIVGYEPLWGIVVQSTSELVLGASVGALLGGLRWGGRGILRFALLGAAAFVLPFVGLEGILIPVRAAFERTAQQAGPIALLLYVTPFGAVVGALLGLGLQRRDHRSPPAPAQEGTSA